MVGGDSDAPQTSPSLEKQFEKLGVQLGDSGSLRECIRVVVLEIKSATGLIQASLLLVHQSKPISGICFMSNEMPRYVVNQVTAGDYDCPRKLLKLLTDLHAAFRMLNLRNDFLRKKFDSMKYDLRRGEDVYYDVKIRGLVTGGDSVGDQGTQGQSSN